MPEQLVHAHDLLDRAVITVFAGVVNSLGVRPTWCALRALRRSAVTDAGSSEDDEGTENSSLTSRVGPSYGVLERRLFFVRRKMNALEFVIENLPHALSQYTATQQPRFLWDARLSTEERTFAGVHEMVHAVLHPPGSTSVGEYETPVEERLAQHVANRTCEHFSVGDYMDFVRTVWSR